MRLTFHNPFVVDKEEGKILFLKNVYIAVSVFSKIVRKISTSRTKYKISFINGSPFFRQSQISKWMILEDFSDP